MRRLLLIPPIAGIAVALATAAAGADRPAVRQDASLGEQLYATQCVNCHAVDGLGVEGRGPSLVDEGPAAVDFVLRTGRMPLAEPGLQARRGPVRYTEQEIVALVEYAGAFGDGPAIPDVDPARGDVTAGGELYRLNCASCHVASGSGAAIGGGREAPTVMDATPTQIGQAVVIGPGAMPAFDSLDEGDLDDLAAYVDALRDEGATGIDSFGGAGPVAEGLAAWLLGLIPLIAVTRWIGSAHEGRDPE